MLESAVEPILATLTDKIPEKDYVYEVKWDGIRAIITFKDGDIRTTSRNKKVSPLIPGAERNNVFDEENGIFDAELVAADLADEATDFTPNSGT